MSQIKKGLKGAIFEYSLRTLRNLCALCGLRLLQGTQRSLRSAKDARRQRDNRDVSNQERIEGCDIRIFFANSAESLRTLRAEIAPRDAKIAKKREGRKETT